MSRREALKPFSNVVCPGCKRSLDDVIESLVRQRGRFKGQREAARAERDRYREALLLIADTATIDAALDPDRALRVARHALND